MTKLVFINPGHSKNCNPDPGATGNGYKEADLAFKIGIRLASELVSCGVMSEIYQQYEGTTANAQLNQVPKRANASNADLFVSIHLNAGSAVAKGTETLYAKNSVEGRKIATIINEELTKPIDDRTFKNRGPKEDVRNLLVLRATKMPAALVEVGFISNAEESAFIANHINEIAKALCRAICKYLNVTQKEEPVITNAAHFRLEPVNSAYNCYVNDELKLKENKLSTCLTWINENFK